ncbi:hypothetical protein GCM10025762_48610 [Haloechinothrix salitolerans]
MSHDPSPLAKLPDISEVVPFGAREEDQRCFDEIRAVLQKYDALQRFGVTLLHEHFDIGDDEVLVESVDVVNRVLSSTPGKPNRRPGVIETSWRLDDPVGRQRCETLCIRDRDIDGNEYHRQQHYMTG